MLIRISCVDTVTTEQFRQAEDIETVVQNHLHDIGFDPEDIVLEVEYD
jgi:hypothetical protein